MSDLEDFLRQAAKRKPQQQQQQQQQQREVVEILDDGVEVIDAEILTPLSSQDTIHDNIPDEPNRLGSLGSNRKSSGPEKKPPSMGLDGHCGNGYLSFGLVVADVYAN